MFLFSDVVVVVARMKISPSFKKIKEKILSNVIM